MPGSDTTLNPALAPGEGRVVMVMNETQDDGKWGAEIAVDGVRPEWLEDGPQPMLLHNEVGWHTFNCHNVDPAKVGWVFTGDGRPNVDIICLPADHPHYRTPATRTTDEQLTHYAQRCQALVERMAGRSVVGWADYDEAREIVAGGKVVDGDLVAARDVVLQVHKDRGFTNLDRTDLDNGDFDDQQPMLIALAAIKRGRQLAAGEG